MAVLRTLLEGNALTRRLGIQHPFFLAPMAGVSTPELVAAVSNAGGMGMYGAGQASKDVMGRFLGDVQKLFVDKAPLGVNLFVPSGFYLKRELWTPDQGAAVDEVARLQAARFAELSKDPAKALPASSSASLEDLEANFAAQVDALVEASVKVVSFHFGWPKAPEAQRLRNSGAMLIGNATCVAEARLLRDLGADAIIAQGVEAGGHRGSFLEPPNDMRTVQLVRALVEELQGAVPVVAAGGIMDGAGAIACLAAGASAVQLGTAFLTAREAATHKLHRAALEAGERSTAVTQAFTGKFARSLENRWVHDLDGVSRRLPNCYNCLPGGRALSAEASKAGEVEAMMLWAGENYRHCRRGLAAAEILAQVVEEARGSAQEAKL